MNENLPAGFISVDDAVALIKKDTRDNPVVDMDYLISHINWIELAHNFRIPRVRLLPPDQVRRSRNGKMIYEEIIGNEYVYLDTPFNTELLKKTIYDKYREEVGHEYREVLTRGISTVADDKSGNSAVKPRKNTPNTKVGAVIGSGSGTSTTNGQGLNV